MRAIVEKDMQAWGRKTERDEDGDKREKERWG